MKTVHLDYEFRSGVDITEVGSHRTSIDPRFELFMAAVSQEERVWLWVNPRFGGSPDNAEAERMLAEADEIYAHNAPNEQANTWGALAQGKACPFKVEPPLTKWRCTAAMARKAGLPYGLAELAETLKLGEQKGREGKALIRFFSSPTDTGEFNDPAAHPEKWAQFCEYCRQDVRVEMQVHQRLRAFELTGAALATFQFDLRMNQRGIPINLTAARNAQRIIDREQAGVTAEFRKLTGLNPTQREKVRLLVGLPNMQSATVEAALLDPLMDPGTRHLLGMYQKVSYSAVKKIQTMLDCVCPDGRVRGAHMYYGAGTGRWSGKLLQPQNFRKTDKEFRPMVDQIYSAICEGISAEGLDLIYGNPLECVANCIRNFIHHPKQPLLDGDYAQVEARIICWLAGQDDVLEMWRAGRDLYKWMAGHTYGIAETAVDADQREVGKRIILGAGFQMGPPKFQSSCLSQYQLDLPLDLCERGIRMFRTLCKRIVAYWYFLNDRAKEAVRYPGTQQGPFVVRQIAGMPFLLFRLRSGRSLAYPQPAIEMVPWRKHIATSFDEEDLAKAAEEPEYREQLTYWGQLPLTTQWGRIKLYGGKLAENETQATAADFMAHGAIVAESRGMEPFMLVHDQGLALRTGTQTAEDYERALGDLPAWAKGFPMKVEAKVAPYYRK